MKNEDDDILKDGVQIFTHDARQRYEDKLVRHQMMLSGWYEDKFGSEDLRKQPTFGSMFSDVQRMADDPKPEVKPVIDHLDALPEKEVSLKATPTDGEHQNFDLDYPSSSPVAKLLCPTTGEQVIDDGHLNPEMKPTKEQLLDADKQQRKQSNVDQTVDQETDDVVVNSVENQNGAKPASTTGQSSTDLVSDAGSALGSAVCCLAKCEALLLAVNDGSCGKALVSVIGKLKLIKDNLGSLLDELARVETNIQSMGSFKTLEPQVEIDEYEVKAEIPDEYDNLSDHETKEEDKDLLTGGDKVKMEMSEHDNNSVESCDVCDEPFRSYQALEMHQRHCGSRKSKKCGQCNKRFPNLKKYNLHMAKKHAEHKCEVCGLIFDGKMNLLRHRKAEKHYAEEQQIQCDKCDKVLMSNYSYKNHIEHFHSKNRVCKICFEAFDIVKELREHMKSAHGEKLNNLSCSTCDQSFNSVISLHKHMNAANHGTFTCEVCSKVFASEATLKIHIKNRHSQNFKCQHCDELFDCKMDMRNHIKAVHTVKQQLVCQTCGHSTHSKGAFWRHLKIHGARTHKCEYCEKSFHVKHALTTHMRVHTGEKPYVCQICGTAFRKNSGLSRHKIVHTGEKPFVCYLCGKGFNQKGNLKTHMKSHISGNLPHPKD